jgi:hypothetical protein
MRIPTPEEEATDPDVADEMYEAATVALRERTRDRKRYPLVFEEVCNYGFRRNLWGLRSIAIIASAIGIAVACLLLGLSLLDVLPLEAWPLLVVLALDAVLLILLWKIVNEDWVFETGDAYAKALLNATEVMT